MKSYRDGYSAAFKGCDFFAYVPLIITGSAAQKPVTVEICQVLFMLKTDQPRMLQHNYFNCTM